ESVHVDVVVDLEVIAADEGEKSGEQQDAAEDDRDPGRDTESGRIVHVDGVYDHDDVFGESDGKVEGSW
ncbi:hypothetical protein BVRB_037320, partial [Beta vulgaris subsp. vulgaris]